MNTQNSHPPRSTIKDILTIPHTEGILVRWTTDININYKSFVSVSRHLCTPIPIHRDIGRYIVWHPPMNSKCRKWRRIPLFANGERIAIFGVSLNPVFVPVGAVFVPKCAKVVPKFVILCQFVPSCVTRLWENHPFCQKYLTFSLFFRVTHQKSVSRYRILCHGMPVPCHHKIFLCHYVIR